MNILVINAGSSSLKYQLIDMKDETVIAKGNCDSRADYQKYEKEDDDLGNQRRLLHRT